MKPADYLFAFRKITEQMYELTAAKNKDYAGDADAFANFRLVEHIGVCPVEVGILTRLSDKLARAGRLIHKDAAVKTEGIEDTLMDMAVYSIILLVYLQEKHRLEGSANVNDIMSQIPFNSPEPPTDYYYSAKDKRMWFKQPETEVEVDEAAEKLAR